MSDIIGYLQLKGTLTIMKHNHVCVLAYRGFGGHPFLGPLQLENRTFHALASFDVFMDYALTCRSDGLQVPSKAALAIYCGC